VGYPAQTVGWQPQSIVPIFSFGQDWLVTLRSSDPSFTWPVGSTVTAFCYPPPPVYTRNPASTGPLFSWAGVISGGDVDFDAPSADCDQVPDHSVLRIMATMPSNSPDGYDSCCWAQGQVCRRDVS
jgi:hypothetical protein